MSVTLNEKIETRTDRKRRRSFFEINRIVYARIRINVLIYYVKRFKKMFN